MADERKYFVLCANNCKFESMTKEQIFAAIEQAISTGEIQNVDTGFVTKIKEQNSGAALSFWVGTQAQYNAISEKANNCFYIITDDTTAEDINAAVVELRKTVEQNSENINSLRSTVVEKGKNLLTVPNPYLSGVPSLQDMTIEGISKYSVLRMSFEITDLFNEQNAYGISSDIRYEITLYKQGILLNNGSLQYKFIGDVLVYADFEENGDWVSGIAAVKITLTLDGDNITSAHSYVANNPFTKSFKVSNIYQIYGIC